MRTVHSERKAHRIDGVVHWAEVAIRSEPCDGPTAVVLSDSVVAALRAASASDFDDLAYCLRAAVMAQFNVANLAGELPLIDSTRFQTEIDEVRMSEIPCRDLVGLMLTAAAMNATAAYLCEWDLTIGR